MYELPLRYRIALRDPADLPFPDCMHCLVTLDRSTRAFRRTESKAGRNPLLDESMVLLDDVIQVRRCSAATAPAEFAGLLQLGDRAVAGRMPIDIDDAWWGPTTG